MTLTGFFVLLLQVLPFREWTKLKTYRCIVFKCLNTKLYPLQKAQPEAYSFFLKISHISASIFL